MKKIFASPWFPLIILIITFFVALLCKQYENTLVAAGTVGAVVTAVWAIFYRDLSEFENRPRLIIKEPGFKPPFYRQAPEKGIIKVDNKLVEHEAGKGYYINIQLRNIGNRVAKNCQPFLTAMWEWNRNDWQKKENWISVALRWAAGEDYEYIESIQALGRFGKVKEERNLIPQRHYYFNLGCISTQHAEKLRILQVIKLYAQDSEFGPGEYCFEVTVTGEEVDPLVRYFKVRWDGGCTEDLNEVERIFFVSMHNDSPCKN
jgi:hypothetical protein